MNKHMLFGATAIATVFALASPALAQSDPDQGAPAAAQDSPGAQANSGDIVVTGSRIRSNGYDQPTPVTTIPTETLQAAAPTSLTDGLNQLPQLSGSRTGVSCCAPNVGVGNFLNLRNLGTNRLLVLLDGNRVNPTTEQGEVNVDLLPELLVSRVDVVTGGASAAYGSDAVSGVVNYIIDNKFTGLKLLGQTGISDYGDDFHYKLGAAGGLSFAGGRGHVVASFEHYDSKGFAVDDRPYANMAHDIGGSGTAASPYYTFYGSRTITATNGGVIVNSGGLPIPDASNPLAGLVFLPNGETRPFVMGATVPGQANTRLGGDGYVYSPIDVLPHLRTDKAYARFSYELSDGLEFHVRGTAGWVDSQRDTNENGQRGTTPFTIYRDNAFLPASVGAAMDAAGVTSFRLGRQSRDFGLAHTTYKVDTYDINAGFDGKIGPSWTWQANVSYGATNTDVSVSNNAIFDNLYAAADAVRDPATGQIVCRANLTNPGSHPGCVPINLFGDGTPSADSLGYVLGTSTGTVKNTQLVASVNAQGDLFRLPAGAVKLAVGAEYRRRTLREISNPTALGQVNATGIQGLPPSICAPPTPCRYGRFNFSNFGEADADDDIKEAYVEAQVPLLRDVTLIHALELNGAYRYADYQYGGGQSTWKVGVSYEPFADLRFRGTRSRDIRAPNLYELFASPVTSNEVILDPVTNISYTALAVVTQGNPDLRPEKADTWTLGAVYQPQWFPGFAASVDYWDISIDDVIAQARAATVLVRCSQGDATACGLITRDASGGLLQVKSSQLNLNQRKTRGIDFDLSYRHPAGSGVLTARALLSHLINYQETTASGTVNYTGFPGHPKWQGNFNLSWGNDHGEIFLQERYVSPVNWNNQPALARYYAPQDTGSVFYTDVTLKGFVGEGRKFEIYATVNNLFNAKPPIMAVGQAGFGDPTMIGLDNTTTGFDVVGRYFTTGVRLRF